MIFLDQSCLEQTILTRFLYFFCLIYWSSKRNWEEICQIIHRIKKFEFHLVEYICRVQCCTNLKLHDIAKLMWKVANRNRACISGLKCVYPFHQEGEHTLFQEHWASSERFWFVHWAVLPYIVVVSIKQSEFPSS